MRTPVVVLAASLLVGASSPEARTPDAQKKLDKMLAGRLAGDASSCVPARVTDAAVAIDDYTLLFRDGSKIWRNDVHGGNGCGMIGHPYAMVTEGRAARHCSGEGVAVVDLSEAGGGAAVGSCILGDFIPYTKEK